MTDEELLASYTRATLKCNTIVKAYFAEGSLQNVTERLRRMGRHPEMALLAAFGTCREELITEAMLREYAERKHISTGTRPQKAEAPAAGVVSDYCKGCQYRSKTYGDTCEYITIERKRRGCPAGDGCTRRKLIRGRAKT